MMPLQHALAATASRLGVAYGYTITIWSSGALVIYLHGKPDVQDVFIFVIGASFGFGLVSAATWPWRRSHPPLPPTAVWDNVCALPAVACAYGVAAALHERLAAYAVTPLAATLLYIALLSGLTCLVSRARRA